jgi:hypothetical protein
MADATTTVEVQISEGGVIRVEGLQRDRRRSSDLRITLPDGRVILAHGRGPDDAWEVYFEDRSDAVGGAGVSMAVALLMGHKFGQEEVPEWVDRFDDALFAKPPSADICNLS